LHHSIIEAFLRHQAIVFGVVGLMVAAIVLVVVRFLVKLELFADPTRGEMAAGGRPRHLGWVIGGGVALLAIGGAVGFAYGRDNPKDGLGLLRIPDLTCDHHGHKLVLFLHGWNGDREETWQRYPDLVCGDEEARDYDVLSIGFPTYLIGKNNTMEATGGWLADKLAAKNLDHYDKIAIVAHSIGGLLARQIVLEQRPELKNIVLLVEVGTPHLGPYKYTGLAGDTGTLGARLVGEFQAGSPYLQKLDTDWQHLGEKPHTFCEGSPNDDVVSLESAQYGCDEKHAYPSLGHVQLVKPTDIGDDRYAIPMHTVKKYLR
jgi:pimeloyl-ACP methyl ester carboxylesterase